MIDRLRRKLREVRYYSAHRRYSIWSRLVALAVVVSVVVGAVFIVVMEQLVVVRTTAELERGGLAQLPDGRMIAIGGSADGTVLWTQGKAYGEFFAQRDQVLRGWPYPSRVDGVPLRLDINVFAESGVRTHVTLAPDDAIRAALGDLVAAEPLRPTANDHRVLAAWLSGGGAVATDRRDWAATSGALITWIGMLFGAQLVVILLARLSWRYASVRYRNRHVERLQEGRCHNCGYDMRGLEFSDRCPECGTLVT